MRMQTAEKSKGLDSETFISYKCLPGGWGRGQKETLDVERWVIVYFLVVIVIMYHLLSMLSLILSHLKLTMLKNVVK